jgi:hypothetical protein
MKISSYILISLLIIYPSIASAYIGPGLGAGALASVVGILAGFLMLVVGVVWYPIKRVIKYFKGKK